MLRTTLHLVITLHLLPFLEAKAADPVVSTSELGEILQYPADRLEVEDLTAKGNNSHGDGLIAAHRYRTNDQTFAPVTIVVAEAGMLLTPKLRTEIESAIETSPNNDTPPQVRKISIDDDIYGFTGLGAVGPGGAQERIIVTLPKQSKDIQITVSIPGEDLIEPLPGAETYHTALTETGMEASLIESAKMAVSNVLLASQTAAPEPPQPPTPPAPKEKPTPPPPTENPTPPAETPEAEKPNTLLYVLLGLLVVVIVAVVLRKARKQ